MNNYLSTLLSTQKTNSESSENTEVSLSVKKSRTPEFLHLNAEVSNDAGEIVIDNKGEMKMEPGQKLCKECGLPFTPKGRESYCTREHYRPCPVCQKPVLIKYLSDPTPCCSKECTKLKRSGSKKMIAPAAVSTANTQSTYSFEDFAQGEKRKYVGRDGVMGLKNGHVYTIEIDRDPVYHNYHVTATYDHTEDKSCDCMIICCSMLNLNNNVFVKLDKSTEHNSEES